MEDSIERMEKEEFERRNKKDGLTLEEVEKLIDVKFENLPLKDMVNFES